MIYPNQKAPKLILPTLQHGDFDLSKQAPRHFTMLVFFRGLHCPICVTYLTKLVELLSAFDNLGVNAIAISSDNLDRASSMAEKVSSNSLRQAYISKGSGKTSMGIHEPDFFPEPGIFLVRADNTIYYISLQSMPFARSSFKDLLAAIQFILSKSYPARGEA
jgi:peroxiredoxin